MRNKYYLIASFLIVSFSCVAQQWKTELSKYEGQPVKEIIARMEIYFDQVGATKANKYHHWIRWKDHAINHQNEDGFLFNFTQTNRDLLQKLVKKESSINYNDKRHFHGSWESINVTNVTAPNTNAPHMGRINCIAKPPSNANIIYAGAAVGGVWKTTNHGVSWQPLWDGMVQMGVSDIVIDSENENHILVLTGDADARFIPSSGVFESYDAGLTWRPLFEFPISNNLFGYSMIQDKENPDRYYLAFNGGLLLRINSAFYPATFETLTTTGTYFDLEYDNAANPTLYIASNKGLYKKPPGQPIQLIDNATAGLPTWTTSRSNVAVSQNDPDVIYYLSANHENNDYGLYKSIDGGITFDLKVDQTNANNLKLVEQEDYDMSIAIDPFNDDKVYIGTVGHYRTDDVDAGFWQFDWENLHADIHNQYFIDGNFYICTDGGLSYRPINDIDFISLSVGLNVLQFHDIDVSGSKIVGGAQDNGTIFWNEGDLTGIRKIAQDGFDCFYHPTNSNIVFTSDQSNKNKSTNNGNTNIIINAAEWHDPISLAVDDLDKVIMHAVDKLKISYNGGSSWSDSISIFGMPENVRAMSQCAADPNVFYISKPDSLARTANFNDSAPNINWTYPNFSSLPSPYIRSILVHPDSCDVVFATSSGYLSAQIFKSIDGGTTWNPYSNGIENLPVYCIYYDHVNGNGYYIGTELGVFYKNNTMDDWIPFSTYLPRVPVYDLKITDTHVYAGTYGRGIWKSPRYKTCSSNLFLYQSNDPTDGKPSGHQIHKASNTIVSNRVIQGGAGSCVLYQAGNYLDLTDGFHAKNNNIFVAKNAGCIE